MSTTYQSPDDLAYARHLMQAANKEAAAFLNLKATAERQDGAIPEKYRELMSVAVALTTQCALLPRCARQQCREGGRHAGGGGRNGVHRRSLARGGGRGPWAHGDAAIRRENQAGQAVDWRAASNRGGDRP